MSKQEHVYRTSYKNRESTTYAVVSFGICLALSLYGKVTFAIILFTPLFLYYVVSFARCFYDKITITDVDITVIYYFVTKRIDWKEISVIEPKLTGFLLSDPVSDTRIFVSKDTINLWTFVKAVGEYRHDLIQPTRSFFHESPWIALVFVLAGVYIIYFSVARMLAEPYNFFPKIVVLLFGVGFVLITMFFLREFSFDKDKLIIKTIQKNRSISLNGISDFSYGVYNTMLIFAKNKYSVTIGNLLEGMPSFLLMFYSWKYSYKQQIHETIEYE